MPTSAVRPRPASTVRAPTATGIGSGSLPTRSAVRAGGAARPASMARSTENRVRRRVAAHEVRIRTRRTGAAAAGRSPRLTAVAGSPTSVSAVAFESLGASRVPTTNPRIVATRPSAVDSMTKMADTCRGVSPTAFNRPSSRRCCSARAPARIATTVAATASRMRAYMVSTSRIGAASWTAAARCSCQVWRPREPAGAPARIVPTVAGAAPGSASRRPIAQRHVDSSGARWRRTGVPVHTTPGLERG